jgi:hypothetical protein
MSHKFYSCVQEILFSIPPDSLERMDITEEILSLRDAYLSGGGQYRKGGAMMQHMLQQPPLLVQMLLHHGIFSISFVLTK